MIVSFNRLPRLKIFRRFFVHRIDFLFVVFIDLIDLMLSQVITVKTLIISLKVIEYWALNRALGALFSTHLSTFVTYGFVFWFDDSAATFNIDPISELMVIDWELFLTFALRYWIVTWIELLSRVVPHFFLLCLAKCNETNRRVSWFPKIPLKHITLLFHQANSLIFSFFSILNSYFTPNLLRFLSIGQSFNTLTFDWKVLEELDEALSFGIFFLPLFSLLLTIIWDAPKIWDTAYFWPIPIALVDVFRSSEVILSIISFVVWALLCRT